MPVKAKEFTYMWEIENFSMLPHQHGEELISDMFVVDKWDNLECYVSLYPRGDKSENFDTEGYISLYLCTTAKDLDSKHTFSLTIVSTEPSSDISRIIENVAVNEGYGFPILMSLDNLYAKNQLYLPNDTLTVRCYLMPDDECAEETVVHNESESVPNFIRSCSSRTSIQVNRRSITLPVQNVRELEKRKDNVSFVLETALIESASLKITLNFSELAKEDFVKIEICQTNLPLEEERLFVKCKMTVLSTRKQYQDSRESTHLFQSSLEDVWHFPEFIKTSNLTHDKYIYLDETLLLQFEFAFSCKSTVYHLETNYTPITLETKEDRCGSNLFTNLEDLYLDGKFCDVELRTGDETFPAHKLVLCAMSPVFRAMFENDLKERDSNVVEIEDVDPDTLRRMLIFMYSDVLKEELSIENVSKLFRALDKYDLDTLRRRCSMLLASSLSVASVCDVLVLADAHQDNFLLTAVHHFISSHSNETFNSEHWVRFMSAKPKLSGEIMHQILIKKTFVLSS